MLCELPLPAALSLTANSDLVADGGDLVIDGALSGTHSLSTFAGTDTITLTATSPSFSGILDAAEGMLVNAGTLAYATVIAECIGDYVDGATTISGVDLAFSSHATSASGAVLDWTTDSTMDDFIIEASDDDGATWTTAAYAALDDESVFITGLTADTQYALRITGQTTTGIGQRAYSSITTAATSHYDIYEVSLPDSGVVHGPNTHALTFTTPSNAPVVVRAASAEEAVRQALGGHIVLHGDTTYLSAYALNFHFDMAFVDTGHYTGPAFRFQDAASGAGTAYNSYVEIAAAKLTTTLTLDGLSTDEEKDSGAYTTVGGSLLELDLGLDAALPTGTTVTLSLESGADELALWDDSNLMTANLVLGVSAPMSTPITTLTWTKGTDTIPTTLYAQAMVDGVSPIRYVLAVALPGASAPPATDKAKQTNVDFQVTPYRPEVRNLDSEKIEGTTTGVTVGIRNNQGTTREDANMIRVDLHDVVASGDHLKISRSNININVYKPDNSGKLEGQAGVNALLDDGTTLNATLTLDGAGNGTIFVDWTDLAVPLGGGVSDLTVQEVDAGGTPIAGKTFTITFKPFNSLVVLIAGHTQSGGAIANDPYADHGSGTADRAETLRKSGFDVIMFAEDPGNHLKLVETSCGTAGTVANIENNLKNATMNRFVNDLVFIGYSHGGGLMHDILDDINGHHGDYDNATVPFTAYIDAVQNPHGTPVKFPVAETRQPALTSYHMNFYESNEKKGFPHGAATAVGGGATVINHTDFDLTGDNVSHGGADSIDHDKDKTGGSLGILDELKTNILSLYLHIDK